MRTTINIDDDVMRELKQLAASTDRTLKAVIEDAVRSELARRKQHLSDDEVPRVITYKGRGTRRGVDLNSSAGLREFMDGKK